MCPPPLFFSGKCSLIQLPPCSPASSLGDASWWAAKCFQRSKCIQTFLNRASKSAAGVQDCCCLGQGMQEECCGSEPSHHHGEFWLIPKGRVIASPMSTFVFWWRRCFSPESSQALGTSCSITPGQGLTARGERAVSVRQEQAAACQDTGSRAPAPGSLQGMMSPRCACFQSPAAGRRPHYQPSEHFRLLENV